MAIFSTILAWLGRRVASWGLGSLTSLAFLGPLGPILTSIGNAVGSVITAVFEIIASLAKSAEGRVVLALCAAGLGFLYLRFHYVEEGRAEGRAYAARQVKLALAHQKALLQCPPPQTRRK